MVKKKTESQTQLEINTDDTKKSSVKKEAPIVPTTTSDEKIANLGSYTPEQVAIVKNTVAKGTTNIELAYFLQVSESVGLSPFNKEIWCYKDHRGNLIVFVGRDGFLRKAQEDNRFLSINSSEVREKDEFATDIPNGKIIHTITKGSNKERGAIVGAYAVVEKRDARDSVAYVDFETYCRNSPTWKSHPSSMIKKVAETVVLKKSFGFFSGVQSEYDFDITDGVAKPINTETAHQVNLIIDMIEKCESIDDFKQLRDELQTDMPEILSNKEINDKLIDKLTKLKK